MCRNPGCKIIIFFHPWSCSDADVTILCAFCGYWSVWSPWLVCSPIHKLVHCYGRSMYMMSFSATKVCRTLMVPLSPNIGGRCGRRVGTAKVPTSSADVEVQTPDTTDSNKLVLLRVNDEGRFVCHVCEKTFKTTNILRTHMFTHNEKKDFQCEMCGSAFRTKGSLIRHNRRHTDERPYRCTLCGISFRESGALTRHMKSITPCTEKIRFSQCKEILVSKDGVQKEEQALAETTETEGQTLPVVAVVDGGQELVHELHIQVVNETVTGQQVVESQSEPLLEGDSLICQAIINSGITLETQSVTEHAESDINKETPPSPEAESRVADIQVMEECVEMETEETVELSENEGETAPVKVYKCPHCNRVFKALNYLRFHVKGHLGFKPFKCIVCQKEFLTGYLLKKHMEVHLSERRYKCGECGKLYKTIGHVREHMRVHSDERPYHCGYCEKCYKTKNALQVHQRTHVQEKPYVCPHCSRAFREKGSLVRHIRHHTGEKPFKCPKCSRGFAEHGTLNRHLRAKGGCYGGQKDPEQAVPSKDDHMSAESIAVITEDPHAVLVEFSSVVADTQEYIIGASTEEAVQADEVALIQNTQGQDNMMGGHIMQVVQQLVSQSQQQGGSGRHIIVRNVSPAEATGAATATISDCGDTITIATPESLTEQVALTLASAIGDATILTERADSTVTMVTATDASEPEEEFVITTVPDEVEVQTVVV
uniref:Transcription factor E4F1 n=1 Tax=Denticeps clupeoides TaxID=299321 RepID=A0AAY4BGZ1_9TELE